MEYKVTALTAEVATGNVIRSDWTLTHTDGVHSAYRYGAVGVPTNPTAIVYATVTEAQAIQATKDLLGPEYIATLEASVLAEIEAQAHPTTITGLPWAPPAPPLLP